MLGTALTGRCRHDWQNTKYILSLFGRRTSEARRKYSEFVEKGVCDGERPELVGGGPAAMAGLPIKSLNRKKIEAKE